MKIRKATLQDIDQVEKSYIELLLHEQKHKAYTVWQLGVYPTRDTAQKSCLTGDLYVVEQDGEICASIIANQTQPKEYHHINWKYQALSDEIFVIHLLCVRPSKAGCGFGKALVEYIINEGKKRHYKAVRLDTGNQNEPAKGLYTKLGFELAGITTMAIGGVIHHNQHLFYEKNISS